MPSRRRVSPYVLVAAAAILLAACGGQKDSAQSLIADVESTVAAAAPEASKYVPGQLADVQAQLDALKASFGKQDFAAVVAGAPAVQNAAQALATAAAAKKDEILKTLDDQWARLAGVLPEYVTAIQKRIDLLGNKANKRMAAGIDLDAAKAGLSDAAALWSKAKAAFAAGNMEEAVSTAKGVNAKILALATALKLDLGETAAVGASSPGRAPGGSRGS
jgi:hypothetical protein